MPTFWGASGTATVGRTETAMLSGTATVAATPSVLVSGTATVDRETLTAWAAQVRRTSTRVLLGEAGEDMVRLRDGVTVNVDGGSPVATASFRVTDARMAYFADGSLVTGGIPVSIRCRVATDGAQADTAVFRGTTEGASNEDPYVPTAAIQCAGEGAEWLDSVGCIALTAFGGFTRAEILRAFAEAAGIDGTRILGGEGSGSVRLALDLSGLSVWELARRFSLVEDWYLRPEGTDLRLIPATDVVGPAASPIFAFAPENYLSVREDPPVRPVTRRLLSTVGIPEEFFSASETEETTAEIVGGTDPLGVRWEIRTETTTVNGTVTRQRIEEWRDIAIPGVTPSAVAWRLWRLTETETDWRRVTVDGVSLRTSRIDEQRTTVREWYSPPCRSSSGSVWSDGTRHIASAATWQVTSTSVTTYTYEDEPSCLLSARVTKRGGWYSEVVASGGHTYDGGEDRADTVYQWIAATDTPPYEQTDELFTEEDSDSVRAVTSEIVEYGWRVPAGSASVAEEWGERTGSKTRWSTPTGSGVVTEATQEFFLDGETRYASKSYAGALPVLDRASASTPQFRTVPLVLTAVASGNRYAVEQHTETTFDAESLDELTAVARRMFRDQLSPRVTVLHPALPLLRLYDVVTVTDPARALDAKQGYVAAYRLNLDPLNGGLRQETTVVFPLPEYDPEVA